jgi:hypothetical protein
MEREMRAKDQIREAVLRALRFAQSAVNTAVGGPTDGIDVSYPVNFATRANVARNGSVAWAVATQSTYVRQTRRRV